MIITTCITNARSWGRGTTQSEAVFNAFKNCSSHRPTEMRLMTMEVEKEANVFVDPLGNINVIGEHQLLDDFNVPVGRDLFQAFDEFTELLADAIFEAEEAEA